MGEIESVINAFIEPVAVFMMLGGIILGIQLGPIYFSISILAILFLILINKKKKAKLLGLYREKIEKEWGKEHLEKRNFLNIRNLYDFLRKDSQEEFIIDDITWKDLNMDLVFLKVDHTKSLPGMNYLYNLLRTPIFDGDVLKNRNNIINSLLYNKDIAQQLQIPLSILGKDEGEKVFTYFKQGIDVETKSLIFYRLLSYSVFLSFGLLFINRQLGFSIIIILLMINAGLYQKNKNTVYEEIEIFKYIGNLIKTADSISKIDTLNIDLNQKHLVELLKNTKGIYKNISILKNNSNGGTEVQLLLDYINLITLREIIVFYKTINLVNKHRDDIIEIYNYIGKIDAYIGIASYKSSLNYYCEPELIDNNKRFYMETKGIYHPLLENPVPYSFILDKKGALVTGSNASGKSTYLRTIGINALFAQTLYLVQAKVYKANYFTLLTSIGTTDSIKDGDSYFMAEAKSLKRIIDTLNPDKTVLCILDEIFRGTNTIERISAAGEVLKYMSNRNCGIVAATHDIELTNIVNKQFDNYHFQETIEEKDIKFDYILRHGPCTSRNAIAILRYLGYPEEIYIGANKKVEEYEKINID